MATTYRELALEWAKSEARRGVREVGPNNHGRRVEWYQKFDSLPGEGYAWCNSFIDAAFAAVGRPLNELQRSAGVELTLSLARRAGWVVTDPNPGDLVIFTFSHIGIIDEVHDGYLITVEGNTSSSGAVSDSRYGGDGVYRKRRPRSYARAYIRVPGVKPVPRTVSERRQQERRNRLSAALAKIKRLQMARGYWAWLAWTLGEGPWRGYPPSQAGVRPNVPVRIPLRWRAARAKFLLARKVGR